MKIRKEITKDKPYDTELRMLDAPGRTAVEDLIEKYEDEERRLAEAGLITIDSKGRLHNNTLAGKADRILRDSNEQENMAEQAGQTVQGNSFKKR